MCHSLRTCIFIALGLVLLIFLSQSLFPILFYTCTRDRLFLYRTNIFIDNFQTPRNRQRLCCYNIDSTANTHPTRREREKSCAKSISYENMRKCRLFIFALPSNFPQSKHTHTLGFPVRWKEKNQKAFENVFLVTLLFVSRSFQPWFSVAIRSQVRFHMQSFISAQLSLVPKTLEWKRFCHAPPPTRLSLEKTRGKRCKIREVRNDIFSLYTFSVKAKPIVMCWGWGREKSCFPWCFQFFFLSSDRIFALRFVCTHSHINQN